MKRRASRYKRLVMFDFDGTLFRSEEAKPVQCGPEDFGLAVAAKIANRWLRRK